MQTQLIRFTKSKIMFCACAKNQFYWILRGAVRRIALIIRTNRRLVSRSLERRVRYYRPSCARRSEHRATTLRVEEVIIVITLYALRIQSITNNFAYYNLLDYNATVYSTNNMWFRTVYYISTNIIPYRMIYHKCSPPPHSFFL